MRIAYENFIDTSTLVSVPTSSSAYPETNLFDQRLAITWNAASVVTQVLTIDLGAAKVINTYALINHNISVGATVTFAGGSTTACASTSTVLTYNANMMLAFSSSVTYRYWKVTIANNLVATSIGRVWIGSYITIDPASLLSFNIIKHKTDSFAYNNNRQKYGSVGVAWREFNLNFPITSNATLVLIQTMFDYCQKHSSLIFCNFDTDRTYQIVEPCYCSIANDIEFSHDENMKFTYSLTLEEEL